MLLFMLMLMLMLIFNTFDFPFVRMKISKYFAQKNTKITLFHIGSTMNYNFVNRFHFKFTVICAQLQLFKYRLLRFKEVQEFMQLCAPILAIKFQ